MHVPRSDIRSGFDQQPGGHDVGCRIHQRRTAVSVFHSHFRSRIQEHPERLRSQARRSLQQRGVSLLVACGGVRSCGKEELQNVLVQNAGRAQKGRSPVFVPRVDVGAGLQEHFDDSGVQSVLQRLHKNGTAPVVSRIDVGARREEHSHKSRIGAVHGAGRNTAHQRRPPGVVPAVDIRPGVQKRARRPGVVVGLRGLHQGGRAPEISGFDLRARRKQRPKDFGVRRVFRRDDQRRLPGEVPGVNIGSGGEQRGDNLGARVVSGGPHQRRQPAFVAGLQFGSGGEKRTHSLRIRVPPRRPHERGHSVLVAGVRRGSVP